MFVWFDCRFKKFFHVLRDEGEIQRSNGVFHSTVRRGLESLMDGCSLCEIKQLSQVHCLRHHPHAHLHHERRDRRVREISCESTGIEVPGVPCSSVLSSFLRRSELTIRTAHLLSVVE